MQLLTFVVVIQLISAVVLCGPAAAPKNVPARSKLLVADKSIQPSFRSIQGDTAAAMLAPTNKRPSPRIIATTIADLLAEIRTGNGALVELGSKADGISGTLAEVLKALNDLPTTVQSSSSAITDKIAESTSTLDGRLSSLAEEIVAAVQTSSGGSNQAFQELVNQMTNAVSLLGNLVTIVGP